MSHTVTVRPSAAANKLTRSLAYRGGTLQQNPNTAWNTQATDKSKLSAWETIVDGWQHWHAVHNVVLTVDFEDNDGSY